MVFGNGSSIRGPGWFRLQDGAIPQYVHNTRTKPMNQRELITHVGSLYVMLRQEE